MCRLKKSPRKKMANPPNIDELIRQMTTNSIKLKSLKRKFDDFKGQMKIVQQELNGFQRGLKDMFNEVKKGNVENMEIDHSSAASVLPNGNHVNEHQSVQ